MYINICIYIHTYGIFSSVIFPMGSCPECSRGGLGRALMGPLWGPPGSLWAPPGPSWAGPLWAPWALMGRALMGTLVNQRLGSMANPLNLLATLKLHKAV